MKVRVSEQDPKVNDYLNSVDAADFFFEAETKQIIGQHDLNTVIKIWGFFNKSSVVILFFFFTFLGGTSCSFSTSYGHVRVL